MESYIKKRAVFLDRDGVINKKPLEHDYVKNWEEFEFLPNVATAIRELNKKFLVIIISNQRGIARGVMSKEDLEDIHNRMREALQKQNAKIDGIYFCPHNIEDNCQCRKPKPGMLFKAAKDFKIDLTKSYMIGDDFIDVEAGKKAGCKTILISNLKNNLFQEKKEKKLYPDYIVSNLLEAAKAVLKASGATRWSSLSLFKIFKKIEEFFSKRGLRRIPGINTLYCKAWLPLCDLVYGKAEPKGIALINVQGNKMYVNTAERSIAPKLLMDGIWEKYETELFNKIVKEGMIVVDIGANIGYYTLMAAKLVGQGGTVYAFEPEPDNYKLLCKNIAVNGYTNVVPVQKAVSNRRGKAKLWVNEVNSTNPSLAEDNVLGKTGFVEVEMITLDEFLENTIKVDVIKMDIGGLEGLIVDGAEKILKNNHLKIFMEFWPDGLKNSGTNPLKLLQKLQGYGFEMKVLNERKKILEPIEIFQLSEKTKPYEEFNLLLEK